MVFDYGPPLPGHANGMVLRAFDAAGNLHLTETYYSIGGGFVLTEREMRTRARCKGDDATVDRPYPFAPPPRCSPWARPPASRSPR